MNTLERALIEKVGHEHGWENVLEGRDDLVLLGSARHRAHATITADGNGACWRIELDDNRLMRELARSLGMQPSDASQFVVDSMDTLARLLRRAAELAQSLPDQALDNFRERLKKTLAGIPTGGTEVERIVRQRVGQDVFRDAMMDYWGGACAVTGLVLPEVLRASHAKPWADCETDEERLDVFNGFLLVANLDALFDRGLISFEDTGAMLVSPHLSPAQRSQLRIESSMTLRWLAEEHLPYLAWHRTRLYV
jgi:predicted restriction endonuclease